MIFGLHSGNSKRLVTRHYVSLAHTLPLNYKAKVAAIPGVTIIAGSPNFGLSPQITAIGIGIALVVEAGRRLLSDFNGIPREDCRHVAADTKEWDVL